MPDDEYQGVFYTRNISSSADIKIINADSMEIIVSSTTNEDLGNVDFIEKLTKYILTDNLRSMSIGIAGETASGKSTITNDLIDVLNDYANHHNIKDFIARINSDDYYYDRSEMVKNLGGFDEFVKVYDLDVPQAIELNLMRKHINDLMQQKEVSLPKYDLSGTAIRIDNCLPTKPSRIILSEGLFVLTDEVRDAFDFKIYVDIERHLQEERFFVRANERNLGNSAHEVLRKADVGAMRFVRPSKERADVVLSGSAVRSDYKKFIGRILNIIENIYER